MTDLPSSNPIPDVSTGYEVVNRRQFDFSVNGTLRGVDLGRGANAAVKMKIVYRLITKTQYQALWNTLSLQLGVPIGFDHGDGETYTGYVESWEIERHSAGLWSVTVDFVANRNP